MPVLLGVAAGYILIDVSLALIALTVGFFSALWYVKHVNPAAGIADLGRQPVPQAKPQVAQEEQVAKNNEAERVSMAAMQLRDLAQNMASDVGDHCTLVGKITNQLGALPNDGEQDNSTVVAAAIAQIVGANEKLQVRLADAESKIQSQAEEIRTRHSEARTDALTQLANRRAFDDKLAQCVERFRKTNRPCSLLIFDVDHFKKFNDTHGHQAGDAVLRGVGETLSKVVSTTDLPCRYGGEEFALVMPGTNAKTGRIAGERVRKAIEDMTVVFEEKKLKVKVSIGLAEIREGEGSVQLVRRADEAVYVSKEAGRNCGHWHDGQQCIPMGQDEPTSTENTETAEVLTTAGKSVSPPAASALPAKRSATLRFDMLPDKSVFSDELQRRVSESQRFGVSLSLMHIHVSDYAQLESEFGDAVGHIALDSVAQAIKSALREMDLLGKLEPGCFVAMMPGSSEVEANLVGKRMQEKVAVCAIPLGDRKISLKVQFGVTDVQPDDDSKRIMARARQLLKMELTSGSKGILAKG